MAKKKRASLPRISLLAYSRRDLLAFVQAVEALRGIAADLRTVAEELSRASKARAGRKKAEGPADHLGSA